MADRPENPVTVAEAREIAYRSLVRREHACKELRDKLRRKGVPSQTAAEAVAELEDEGLVSDRRFAEAFTHSRISKLYGPLKIRAELLRRGVSGHLIDGVLSPHDGQWLISAKQWVLKRQGPAWDRKEKARLYRSGTNRGFSHEHMMNAFDAIKSGD